MVPATRHRFLARPSVGIAPELGRQFYFASRVLYPCQWFIRNREEPDEAVIRGHLDDGRPGARAINLD